MGSLRDQLLKAKLVTKDQALKQKTKAKKKQKTSKSADSDQVIKMREFNRKRDEEAKKQRELAIHKQHILEKEQRINRLKNLVNNATIQLGRPGSRRFYFVNRQNRITFFELNDAIASDLESGQTAIIEKPGEPECFCLIQANAARKLKESIPELVLFFQDRELRR